MQKTRQPIRSRSVASAATATVLLVVFGALTMLMVETPNPDSPINTAEEALWWAVVTLTTVGDGDAFPVTLGGRMFTFAVLMAGLGIVAVPTGLLASALARVREEERDGAS